MRIVIESTERPDRKGSLFLTARYEWDDGGPEDLGTGVISTGIISKGVGREEYDNVVQMLLLQLNRHFQTPGVMARILFPEGFSQ